MTCFSRCPRAIAPVRRKQVVGAMCLALGMTAAMAQSSTLLVSPALVRYLEMSPAQVGAMTQVQRAWLVELAGAKSQAEGQQAEPELARICAAVRDQQNAVRQRADALLTDSQRAKIQRLKDAYVQMPLVEAAQNAQLFSGNLTGAPAVLPDGSIDTDFRYVRSAPEVLPGCPIPVNRPYATQDRSTQSLPLPSRP